MSKLHSKHHNLNLDEMDLTVSESKATYEEIKAWVLEQTGMNVSHLYIAQVKRKYGIIKCDNYNKPKSEESTQTQCPPVKESHYRRTQSFWGANRLRTDCEMKFFLSCEFNMDTACVELKYSDVTVIAVDTQRRSREVSESSHAV